MLFASIFVCSALVGLATAAVGGPSFSNEPSGTRALATAKNIPTVELEALRTLYDATNGPHWRWFYLNVTQGVAWNFSGDPNPCVDFWQGIRCTEELVEPYVHVSAIILSAHELSGTLPASIDSFSHIAFLDLGFNQLHGGIPASIGNLTSLRALVLSGNEWACSLEGWLGRLDQLLLFECNLCRLHGHLPSLSGMSLVELQLRGNNITGSLVPIGDLENMRILRINDNQFTGNIPATFTNLTLLTTLDLHHNRLSGPLPAVGWAAMQSLSLQANFLTGPIPALANASSLYFVDLSQNSFSGTIPLELCNAPLTDLLLNHNALTGTMPSCFGNSTLLELEVSYNYLSGTIAAELGNITSLQLLYLDNNFFSGTIPWQLGRLSQLNNLVLNNNLLSGVIPDFFASMPLLQTIHLSHCLFEGSIPPSMGLLSDLVYLYLDSNTFTGPVPTTFAQAPQLTSMFFQNNKLTGTLDGVFNASVQRLTTFNVANNQLTGALPEEAFRIKGLVTFVAVSNCFSGSLPDVMCLADKLECLNLDGLASASYCRTSLLPGMSDAYLLTNVFSGGIPSCLYSMPTLNTLHLSSNGLKGSIPDVLVSSQLIDLSLSHNSLTGTIPSNFQSKAWYNLDLSFNRFTGTLRESFASQAFNLSRISLVQDALLRFNKTPGYIPAVSLRNNRLSGDIPNQLLAYTNISILEGNLFTCNLQQTNLPPHDAGVETYECGSNNFNVSYYAFLAAAGAVGGLVLALWYWRAFVDKYVPVFEWAAMLRRWHRVLNPRMKLIPPAELAKMQSVVYVFLVCDRLCSISTWCTVFILVVLLPLNCFVSSYYGTHSYEYAWTVSGAFLSGYVPMLLQMSLIFVLMVMVCLLIVLAFREFRAFFPPKRREHMEQMSFEEAVLDVVDEDDREGAQSKYSSRAERVGVYVAFFVISLTVVIAANVAYVYIAVYRSSKLLVLAQIGLSIFKLMWNNFGQLYLIRWIHHYLTGSTSDDFKTKGASFFALQLFSSLTNFIAIPCLVVAVINPSCFENVLVSAPTVHSYYFYEECELFGAYFGCFFTAPQLGHTSYTPPFTYSYQCSAGIITYYAPTFIYLSFIVTFVQPVVQVVGLLLYKHAQGDRSTFLFQQLDYWLPLSLHTVSSNDAENAPYLDCAKYDLLNPYLDGNLLLVTVLTYLGVLLTFGQVFPPLAVAMLIAMFSVVLQTRMHVGRFVLMAVEQQQSKYLDILERESQGVGSIPKLRQSIRIIISFACIFFTPFLYDTLGDAVGFMGAYWILIVLPLQPVLMYVGYESYVLLQRRRFDEEVVRQQSKSSFEMQVSPMAGTLLRELERERELKRGGAHGGQGEVRESEASETSEP